MSKYIDAETRDLCAESIATMLGRGDAELYKTFGSRRWVVQRYTDHGITVDPVPGQVVRWMLRTGRLQRGRGPTVTLPDTTP
jgi:hypothetical protein